MRDHAFGVDVKALFVVTLFFYANFGLEIGCPTAWRGYTRADGIAYETESLVSEPQICDRTVRFHAEPP